MYLYISGKRMDAAGGRAPVGAYTVPIKPALTSRPFGLGTKASLQLHFAGLSNSSTAWRRLGGSAR